MSLREKLHDIHITVDDPLRFLKRIADISETVGSLNVTRICDGSTGGKFKVLLRPTETSGWLGNSVQMFSVGKTKVLVIATMPRDDFPTYDEYLTFVRSIVAPLLNTYNRSEQTKHRLSVIPKKNQPGLTGKSAKLFKAFTETANKSSLHPSDWWLFYEFVRACRARLSADDLARLLVVDGFSAEYAYRIVCIYEHLQAFRRPRSEAETVKYYNITRGLKGPPSGS
jgi:hypothetical protein